MPHCKSKKRHPKRRGDKNRCASRTRFVRTASETRGSEKRTDATTKTGQHEQTHKSCILNTYFFRML